MFSNFLNEGIKVSFDMDDTLQFNGDDKVVPREKYINAFKEHWNNDDNGIIVTSRRESESDRNDIEHFLSKNGLPVVPIFYTNGNQKTDTLKAQGVDIHYDDDKREEDALKGTGIKFVNSFDSDLVKLYSTHYDVDVNYED